MIDKDKFIVTLDEKIWYRETFTREELAKLLGCKSSEVEEWLDTDSEAGIVQQAQEDLAAALRDGSAEYDSGDGLSWSHADVPDHLRSIGVADDSSPSPSSEDDGHGPQTAGAPPEGPG